MANNETYRNFFLDERVCYYENNPGADCDEGMARTIRSYLQTQEYGFDLYAIRELPFPQGLPAFMKAVWVDAGIEEFYLCDESTNLMAALQYLWSVGWKVTGTVTKEVNQFMTIRGLRLARG